MTVQTRNKMINFICVNKFQYLQYSLCLHSEALSYLQNSRQISALSERTR